MFVDYNVEAENFKKKTIVEDSSPPRISGIYRVKSNDIYFDVLVVQNDDSSVVDRFWKPDFKDVSLDLWGLWSREKGLYIDVGAHTGFFTLAALKANPANHIITLEPYQLNFHRIISNLRLNGHSPNRASLFNCAASNENKIIKFKVNSNWGYMSKGGKISKEGVDTRCIKLDDLNFNQDEVNLKGLKIDTEGEDFKVLVGSTNLIKKYQPKIIIESNKDNIKEIINFLVSMNYNKIYDEKNLSQLDSAFYNFDKLTVKNIFAEVIYP